MLVRWIMIVVHRTVTGCWWPGSPASPGGMQAWRAPAGNEIAAAVAELREVAGDRPDLLAEEAGIQLGFHEGGLDEPRANAAAQVLIAAGAEESLLPRWIEEGRRRAEIRHRPPVSNPGRRAVRHP
jgi:hypothetical protein